MYKEEVMMIVGSTIGIIVVMLVLILVLIRASDHTYGRRCQQIGQALQQQASYSDHICTLTRKDGSRHVIYMDATLAARDIE